MLAKTNYEKEKYKTNKRTIRNIKGSDELTENSRMISKK